MSTKKICIQCGSEFGPEQRFCPNDGNALRPAGSEDRLIGQVIADRYQVLELLGEGGMGRVYLAEHVRMGRKSAVKVMSPNLALSAEAITRFNREASNASRINHPNVAQIYDFGETNEGMLYLAMEFVEGETLTTIIQRDGRLPPRRAADLTKQTADALAAAHHLGIVHRDLKPDNVMVARHHDGTDWVKVVDFGIAKTVQGSGEAGGSQTVTTAGVSLGTPEYMSPEQLAGERLDSRTDLYSLGLVLFNMLTGDLPYPRVTSKETLVRRLTSKPRTLAEVAPDRFWPPALQAALDRALASETVDRYSSVVDFARDVVAATADVADPDRTVRVTAIRPSAPTQRMAVPESPRPAPRRTNKPAVDSRGRRPAILAAGALLVVLAGAAGAFVATHPHRGAPAQQVVQRSAADSMTVDRGHPSPASPTPTTVAQTGAASPASIADTTHPVVEKSAPSSPESRAEPVTKARKKAQTKNDSSASPANESPKPLPLGGEGGAGSPRGGGGRGAPHGWIRANGDSGAAQALPTNATDADRVSFLVDEIRGHMIRAGNFLNGGNVQKMRAEVRDAQGDAVMLHTLFPAAADTLHLQQAIRAAAIRLVQACPSLLADPTKPFPPGFACEQLFPNMNRGRQGGRGQGRPPAY